MLNQIEEMELLALLEAEEMDRLLTTLDEADRAWFESVNENLPEDGDYRSFFQAMNISDLKRYEQILRILWRSDRDIN